MIIRSSLSAVPIVGSRCGFNLAAGIGRVRNAG